MATITLQDALVALNNSVTENGAATDAQLSDLYTEIINDEGETIDKQPLSRLCDLVFNYVIGDGIAALWARLEMFNPIVFEDANVKNICVTNWGGNFIDGEITLYEASLVTTLGNKFYQNTTITKFDELRYFTGLTTMYVNAQSNLPAGAFYKCSNLTRVTMPEAPISNLRGAFRECIGIGSINISPLTVMPLLQSTFTSSRISTITLKGGVYPSDNWYQTFRATSSSSPYASLTTIAIDGTADLSNISFTDTFNNQANLTTLTGNWNNIKQDIKFAQSSKLTHDSLMVIINGLYDFVGAGSSTRRTLTLHATAKARLTTDDIAIANGKGWSIA